MDASINPPRTQTRIHSRRRFPWLRRSSTKKTSSMRERSFARSPSTRARKRERESSPEEAEEQENIDGSGAKTTPSSSVVPKLENEELQGIDKGEPTLREARGERTYTSIDRKEEMRKEQEHEISDGKSGTITSSPPLLVPELANKELGENVKEEPTTMLVTEGQERQTKEKVKIIPPMPMPKVKHEQEENIKEGEEEKQEASDHESAKTTSSALPVTKQANEESRLGGIGKVEPTMQETREVLERMPDSLPETKQGQMDSDSGSSKITASHHLLGPNLAEEESDLGGMRKKKTPMMEVTEGQDSGKIKDEKILSPSMPEIAESQMERRQKQQEQEISGRERAKITPDLPIPMKRMPDSLPETKQGQMDSDSGSSKITASHHLLGPNLAEEESDLGGMRKKKTPMMEVTEGQDSGKIKDEKILSPSMPEIAESQMERRQKQQEQEISGRERAKITPDLPIPMKRMPDSLPETKQGQIDSDSGSSKITASHHLLVPNLAEEESDLGGMSKKKTPMMEVTEGQESGKIKDEKIFSPSMPEIAESQMERRQKQQEQDISGRERAKITPDLPIPMMANKESELVETNKEEPTHMEAMHEEEKYTSKRTMELILPVMPETEKRLMESNEKEHGVYETDKEEVKMMEPKMQVQGIDRRNLEKDNLMQEKKVEEGIQEGEQLLLATRISARSDPTSANAAIRAGVAPSENIGGTLPSTSTMSAPTNEESSNEMTSLEKKSSLLMPQLQKTQSNIEESNVEKMKIMREEQGKNAELSNWEKKKALMPSPLMPIPENTDLSHKTEVSSSSISSVKNGEKRVSGDAMLFESEQVGEADMSCKASAEKIVQSSSSMLAPASSKNLAGERNSKDPNSSITREEHSMSKMELERASIFKSNSESNKELKALDKPVKDSHRNNSGMDNIASTSRLPALSKEEIQIDRKRPRGMVITEENEKIINERNNMNVENNDKGEASGANISGTYSLSSILAPTMSDGEDEGFPTAKSKSIDEDAGHRNKDVKSQGRDKGESTSNGRSAWTTIGVITMMAGITWLGQMVLMKRLEKVRRQKHT